MSCVTGLLFTILICTDSNVYCVVYFRYHETGSILPGAIGGSKPRVTTPKVNTHFTCGGGGSLIIGGTDSNACTTITHRLLY